MLFVPGGTGTRAGDDVLGPAKEFIKERFPKVKYVLTVCTGSALVAMTGVLDGRRATTNKVSLKRMITIHCPPPGPRGITTPSNISGRLDGLGQPPKVPSLTGFLKHAGPPTGGSGRLRG